MDLRDITVTWMDDREETYPRVSIQVHNGVLHIHQYAGITSTLLRDWHLPLSNIRYWHPAGQEHD